MSKTVSKTFLFNFEEDSWLIQSVGNANKQEAERRRKISQTDIIRFMVRKGMSLDKDSQKNMLESIKKWKEKKGIKIGA